MSFIDDFILCQKRRPRHSRREKLPNCQLLWLETTKNEWKNNNILSKLPIGNFLQKNWSAISPVCNMYLTYPWENIYSYCTYHPWGWCCKLVISLEVNMSFILIFYTQNRPNLNKDFQIKCILIIRENLSQTWITIYFCALSPHFPSLQCFINIWCQWLSC